MKDLKQIGMNIRLLRTEKEMTQERLAAEAGVERSYMGGIERGQRKFSVVILIKVARALGCKPAKLLEGIDENEESIWGKI